MSLDKALEMAGLVWLFSLIGYGVKMFYDFLFSKKKKN